LRASPSGDVPVVLGAELSDAEGGFSIG